MILKNLMSPLTARLEDDYYNITVANHRLITVIRFVAKSYTHPWIFFANRLHLVHHAYGFSFRKTCALEFVERQTKPLSQKLSTHVQFPFCQVLLDKQECKTPTGKEEDGYANSIGKYCCKHLGPLGMFRWLMATIIVTNEFVQLNDTSSLIWSFC